MRIAGNKVHKTSSDPAQGVFLSTWTESSGKGAGRDLQVATKPRPFGQPLWLATQDAIALGVSDHRSQALKLQAVQGVIHRRRDGDFVEFHEQIIVLVNAEA